VQLLSYDPNYPTISLEIVWESDVITLSASLPIAQDLLYRETAEFQSCRLVYDLYLNGLPPPEPIQPDITFGCRKAGDSATSVLLFWKGLWDVVLSFIDGPWNNYHLDFNNNGTTPESYPGFPPGDYYIGVYRIDPAKPKELIVYGECAEAFTATLEVQTTGVSIEVYWDNPVVRQIP
jgi:hypothetical protein